MTNKVHILGINRHRINIDGKGVRTLVAFHGCNLSCHYCINKFCKNNACNYKYYSVDELIATVEIDNLYYIATDGGITFGGGEPLLHADFISSFRQACSPEWNIAIETSLNIERCNLISLIDCIDNWIIDIKDMNPKIYQSYTGVNNRDVIHNLKLLSEAKKQSKCLIRLPYIPGFNCQEDIQKSKRLLLDMGYTNFDEFQYEIID